MEGLSKTAEYRKHNDRTENSSTNRESRKEIEEYDGRDEKDGD